MQTFLATASGGPLALGSSNSATTYEAKAPANRTEIILLGTGTPYPIPTVRARQQRW
jgi:hypothetical protein